MTKPKTCQNRDPLPIRDACGRMLARRGSRTRFTLAIAEEICYRIRADESLLSICRDPRMPTPLTVYNWTRRYPEFKEAYIEARREQVYTAVDRVTDVRKALWAGEMTPAAANAILAIVKSQTARRVPRAYPNRANIGDGPEGELDFSALSEEELQTLRHILAKCEVRQTHEGRSRDGRAGRSSRR